MVYDEGFEFNLGKKDTNEFSSYFNFLKFSKNNGKMPNVRTKHYSHCYEVLIGWFHTDNKKWGCFFGHKKVPNYQEPTNGEAADKLLVVENVIQKAFIENESNEKLIERSQMKENFLKNFESGRFMQTEFNNKLKLENKMKLNNKLASKTNSLLSLNAEFTNHEEVVERINSMNLSWKAEVYEEFKGKTIAEINKFSGRIGKGEMGNNMKFEELKNRKIKNNLRERKFNTSKKFLNFFYSFYINFRYVL